MKLYPILLSMAAFASTFLGGLLATRYREHVGRFAAFSAGVLIAVPLFGLLPETFRLATRASVPLENVMYLTALGFIFLYVLERYFSAHRVCEDGVCRNERHSRGGLLGAVELSAHSFVDGFAIGLGFQVDVMLVSLSPSPSFSMTLPMGSTRSPL
jgi:zinc transporter ZupT